MLSVRPREAGSGEGRTGPLPMPEDMALIGLERGAPPPALEDQVLTEEVEERGSGDG